MKEDGVYVNYISGADTVSKKLGEGNFTMRIPVDIGFVTGDNVWQGGASFTCTARYENGTFTRTNYQNRANFAHAYQNYANYALTTIGVPTITFD